MNRNHLIATELLYDALRAHFGIVVRCGEHRRLYGYLQRARQANPEFAGLAFVRSPRDLDGETWIIKKDLKNATPGE